MVAHKGFSAWICSGGERLPEYEVAVEPNSNKAFCWIACEIGQSFSVRWEDHGSGIDSAGFIILDGFTVPGRFLFGSGTAERGGVRVAGDVERPFIFDEIARGAHVKNKDLGTIVLKIKLVKRLGLTHKPNKPMQVPSPVKGRTYTSYTAAVGYGHAQDVEMQFPKTWACEPYDPRHPGSFVVFVFRYRQKEFLITQGIMPDADVEMEDVSQDNGNTSTGSTTNRALLNAIKLPSLKLPASAPTSRQSSYTYTFPSEEISPISMASNSSGSSSGSRNWSHGSRRHASDTHQQLPAVPSATRVTHAAKYYREHTFYVGEQEVPISKRSVSGK
ncbi:hypothetical protein NM688_g4179 [Phlebia brevispora]|uniref:Uncharacterized protein n=1 Tax=Phlebia brevispora TaxID=194682 RepID=A0ACC1T3N8_9APHY|nr:hypothetical protein NM688_g4179 [Phlebia brevispora]